MPVNRPGKPVWYATVLNCALPSVGWRSGPRGNPGLPCIDVEERLSEFESADPQDTGFDTLTVRVVDRPCFGWQRVTAIVSASRTSWVGICFAIDQPTTRRHQASTTTAR